jgi:hypothetical protein
MIKVRKLHFHVGVMVGSKTYLSLSAEQMKLDMHMATDGVFVLSQDAKLDPVFVPYGTIADAHLDKESYKQFLAKKSK